MTFVPRRALVALATVCLSVASLAQSVPNHGDGSGAPVCGLGKDFHAGRREALYQRLEAAAAEAGEENVGVVLLRGLPATRAYAEFEQDKVFWYFTGIESSDATVVVDVDTRTEILFLPQQNLRAEGWEGELWDAGDAWVKELTGFKNVMVEEELVSTLAEFVDARGIVWVSMHPWLSRAMSADRASPYDRRRRRDPLDGRPSREQTLRERLGALFDTETRKVDVRDLGPHSDELRRVKTSEEVDAMRRASRAGALAMAEAVRSTRPGLGEWELDGLLGFVAMRHGATGHAYNAIVGSGANSCVLHYSASSRVMNDGEVLLIDAGPEVDHYTTDITRTWPVNGRFTERQAELYDAVAAAQAAGIAIMKPGVTMMDVDAAARAVLVERGFANLVRHFTCHYIGMEVHDVGDFDAPFEPGVAITVEPGVYEESTGIGIRIEDVVVVTEDGYEILTRGGLPVDRAAIEALVAEDGLLDVVGS